MEDLKQAGNVGLPFPAAQHLEPLPLDFVALRLIVLPKGTVVDLNRPDMTFGRHHDADIRLPLADISRRHCRFVFGNGNWVVMDLNSLNGVYVNDEPVGQRTLRQGDRVRIGSVVFAVDLAGEYEDLAQHIFPVHHAEKTYTSHRRAS